MQVTMEQGFAPIKLTIEIHSAEERDALRNLFSYDLSIPDYMFRQEMIDKDQQVLLNDLMNAIGSKLVYSKD
jgi:hypothetical protein